MTITTAISPERQKAMDYLTVRADGMPAEQIAGLCKDPGALRAREVEVELANRGRFMPLALDGV